MLDSWRVQLRETVRAMRGGQLEHASRLIRRHELTRFPKGAQVAASLADALRVRTRKSAAEGDIRQAWYDLNEASLMAPHDSRLIGERAKLADQTVSLARTAVSKGDLAEANQLLRHFERFQVQDIRATQLREAVELLGKSKKLAGEGRFTEAHKLLGVAIDLEPELSSLRSMQSDYGVKKKFLQQRSEALRKAIVGSNWREGLTIANDLLGIAPKYQIAIDAKAQCQKSLGSDTAIERPRHDTVTNERSQKKNESPVGQPTSGEPPTRVAGSNEVIEALSGADTANQSKSRPTNRTLKRVKVANIGERELRMNSNLDESQMDSSLKRRTMEPGRLKDANRFLMWIDGVGGFLVCFGTDVMIGQAIPDGGVDVPIQGDLSRRHARIVRSSDAYFIEPFGRVAIDDQEIESKSSLRDPCLIELGRGIRLRFSQPHALSASARLTFESRHRTQPWTDGLLLMSDSLVLGPRSQNHVICPDWQEDLVLFRRNEQLVCRGPSKMEIDGKLVQGQANLSFQSRLVGEDFALSLEPC